MLLLCLPTILICSKEFPSKSKKELYEIFRQSLSSIKFLLSVIEEYNLQEKVTYLLMHKAIINEYTPNSDFYNFLNSFFADSFSADTLRSLYSFNIEYCNFNGLSYDKEKHYPAFGVDKFKCKDCDKEQGNTACYESKPILCHFDGGFNRPSYDALNPIEEYSWSEGIALPINNLPGCFIIDKMVGDAMCEHELGASWKMTLSNQGMIIQNMFMKSFSNHDWDKNGPKVNVFGGFCAYGDPLKNNEVGSWVHHQENHNCY